VAGVVGNSCGFTVLHRRLQRAAPQRAPPDGRVDGRSLPPAPQYFSWVGGAELFQNPVLSLGGGSLGVNISGGLPEAFLARPEHLKDNWRKPYEQHRTDNGRTTGACRTDTVRTPHEHRTQTRTRTTERARLNSVPQRPWPWHL